MCVQEGLGPVQDVTGSPTYLDRSAYENPDTRRKKQGAGQWGGLPDTALELRDGFGVALRDKQELLGLSPQVPA